MPHHSPEVVLSLYLFSSCPESGCSITSTLWKGIIRSFALLGHLTGECDSLTVTPLSKPPLLGFLDQQFHPWNTLRILWTASSPNPEWLCQLTVAHSCSGRSVPGLNQLSTSCTGAGQAKEGQICLVCDNWVALGVQRPYLAFFSILFSVKLPFFSSHPALCSSPDKVCLTQRWSFNHSWSSGWNSWQSEDDQ